MISSAGDLAKLDGRIAELKQIIETGPPKAAITAIKETITLIRAVPGTRSVTKELSSARKALRRRKPKMDRVMKNIAKAEAAFATELSWRKKAAGGVKSGLETYDAAIRLTIGLRLQPRLPDEQAKNIAACKSNPYDLTLNF